MPENITIPEVNEEDGEDDAFMQQENDIIDEDRNLLLEVDYNESETILSSSFAPENIELDSHRVPLGGPLRFIVRSDIFLSFSPSVWTFFPLRSKKKKLGNAGQTKKNLTPAFRGRRRLGLDLVPTFLLSSSSIANLVALSPPSL